MATAQDTTCIRVDHFPIGGAKGADSLEMQLSDILQDHGVPSQTAGDRAKEVVAKLGRQAIMQVVRAPNPWKELKAKANSQSPRLQLVHPSELSEVIQVQARANSGKPVGQTKKKGQSTKAKPVRLNANDVVIPPGIFYQADREPLQQIPLQQVGPEARGVVITDSIEAAAFLRMTQPVSKYGLALLILDHAASNVFSMG